MKEGIHLVDMVEIRYFQTVTKSKENSTQIACCDIVIIGFDQITLIFPMGTQLAIEDTLIYPNSTRTLLSYKNISVTMVSMWKHIMTTIMNINSS